MINTFIWNGYHQRGLSVLTYPYKDGGLAFQNIDLKVETMRLRWIENLMTKKELHKEKIIVDALISNINNISGLKIFLYKKNHTHSIQK